MGAPIPASTGALAVEGVKLKNKLVGKKRQRDADETGPHTMESEDEAESRGRAIKKKIKVDPFGGIHGKKKAEKVETKQSLSAAKDVEVESAISDKAPSVSMQETPSTPERKATELASPAATGQSPTSAKKKKKKKKHKTQNLDSFPILPQSSPSKRRDTSVSCNPMTEKSPLKGVSTTRLVYGVLSCCVLEASPEEASIDKLHQTPKKTTSSPEKLPSSSPHKATPLLNLEGPPPSDGEEHAPSKKKRKRRRKKKSASGNFETSAGKEPEAGASP